ncbi:SpoIID/LytB domain-containing protein [Patescibacteria group bacterium]
MQKLFKICFTLVFVVVVFFFAGVLVQKVVRAVDCLNLDPKTASAGDADYCMGELEKIKSQYAPAQQKNKDDLAKLQSQLNDLNKRISSMTNLLKSLEADILEREEELAYTKEIFDKKTDSYYRFLRTYDPLMPFLSSNSASQAFKEIIFRQKVSEEDRKTITAYAEDLSKLKDDKASLEKNKESLASVQKSVGEKTSLLAGEVAKVDAYLATLTAKQQSFLAAKLESLGLSRSAYNLKGGCSDDRGVDPGFSPAIAFFSFGVPNRVGLNQFGAKGRAEAGQDYQAILHAYYNADITSGYSTAVSIRVSGTNEYGQSFNDSWNIEEYVKHLYEMPASWPMEALKAQAIAARSYALAYTNNGAGSICPSQYCQVVKKEINDGNWQAAVNATSGVVLTNGGSPAKAWYSSTHGGYAFNSGDIGWSATSWTKRLVDASSSVGGFSDLFNSAYDKSSSIFYCDWGSRSAYNRTAWLKADEVADIANVILLAKADASTKSHLYQVDKANPEGTDTWDAARVRTELSSRGVSALGSASSVSVGADFGTGRTTSVSINGVNFDGGEFKDFFNLRAPSNIQIVGPLFNVEKR